MALSTGRGEAPRDPATEKALLRIEDARTLGLAELDLSNLELSRLPEAIGRLSQLEVLRLYNNQLTSLPESMQSLERLGELFLHENPGLRLPVEVLGPTVLEVYSSPTRSPKPPREILDYYFATRGGSARTKPFAAHLLDCLAKLASLRHFLPFLTT